MVTTKPTNIEIFDTFEWFSISIVIMQHPKAKRAENLIEQWMMMKKKKIHTCGCWQLRSSENILFSTKSKYIQCNMLLIWYCHRQSPLHYYCWLLVLLLLKWSTWLEMHGEWFLIDDLNINIKSKPTQIIQKQKKKFKMQPFVSISVVPLLFNIQTFTNNVQEECVKIYSISISEFQWNCRIRMQLFCISYMTIDSEICVVYGFEVEHTAVPEIERGE